jgi:CDP-6-deoxy-D-xylo-4-hexulose-3-dehydrase
MQARKIETRPIIAGNMARHPAFKMFEHRIAGDLTNADTVMKKGFAFACHHAVGHGAREYIVNTIDSFVEEFFNRQAKGKAV